MQLWPARLRAATALCSHAGICRVTNANTPPSRRKTAAAGAKRSSCSPPGRHSAARPSARGREGAWPPAEHSTRACRPAGLRGARHPSLPPRRAPRSLPGRRPGDAGRQRGAEGSRGPLLLPPGRSRSPSPPAGRLRQGSDKPPWARPRRGLSSTC